MWVWDVSFRDKSVDSGCELSSKPNQHIAVRLATQVDSFLRLFLALRNKPHRHCYKVPGYSLSSFILHYTTLGHDSSRHGSPWLYTIFIPNEPTQ